MKKIYYLLFISIISIFLMSCGNYFNPRYYYNSRGSSSEGNVPDNPDIGGGGEGLSPEDDPFNNDNGDKPWNDPNYGGFTLNLDELVIRADFDGNNRPTYRLEKGTWTSHNPAKNSYKNGGNLSSAAGSFTIGNVTYYMYKGKNPTYDPNSSYNQSSRMERFYFYHLVGSSAGKPVDNYLICIDSYSKLVFAFGVPTKWEWAVIKWMPIAWGAVELGWETDSETGKPIYFNNTDGVQYFYEYDPVGIVLPDNTIKIYDWCLNSIAGNRYGPRVEGNVINLDRPIASKDVAGRSPYMPIKVEAGTKDNVTIMAKSLKNVSVKSRVYWAGIFGGDIQNNAWFTYTIAGTAYNNEMGSGVLQNIENLDPRSESTTGMIYLSETKDISVGGQVNFSSQIVAEVRSIEKGATIELASRVDKYNKETSFADTAKFGQRGSGNMAAVSAPILKLKYDVDNEQFVVDTENSVMSNNDLSTTISSYPADFTLKRGETKDITIRYKWMKGNDTSNGEEFEITYTLKFESVQ
ncbi:hypothetical protein [Brachyspira hyodysenteriae]|uniref:Uncharacterized protein n=2 Tax=Brachyspira hyodysenteriae TaxID=159 RepID=A0A3B6VTN6_BRAHO|nr:hypothetical protein [Brachyspira hyodysenteriae]ANN64488.1 hypothetical protein BHYOB78_11620 [Brachyspira hyodysenteriae ATCC 27164]KLI18185.1 hypothetical protein SU45_02500 [Brachyspira hyodysenteriae]KLI22986.1 hypothetical protein SU43_07665 [Brachyspira hyodysenteriae]KLI27675.1 hypothetical protein SZ47_03845 [Brachyspira hyodysenteriae]KLI32671.1 hypothetical protein SZ48_11050 [Brachyspira hyodysenteriae]